MTGKYGESPALKKMINPEEVPWKRDAVVKERRDTTHPKSLINWSTGSRGMILGIVEVDPGHSLLLHHHEGAEEFYYWLSGSGAKVTIDGDEFVAKPGIVFFIPAEAPHGIKNNTKEKQVVLYGLNTAMYRQIWDVPPPK